MGEVIPFPATAVAVSREPVVIKFPINTVSQTRERLTGLQAAAELALRTLDQTKNFDDETVLDGVADVLRAGAVMCQRSRAPTFQESMETRDRIMPQLDATERDEYDRYLAIALTGNDPDEWRVT